MNFNYFFKNTYLKEKRLALSFINGFKKISRPCLGDCLKIYFSHKGSFFFTEGLVVSITKKSFLVPESSIFLYSKIKNYKVKFSFSFFYNLLFNFEKLDYKKLNKSKRSKNATPS